MLVYCSNNKAEVPMAPSRRNVSSSVIHSSLHHTGLNVVSLYGATGLLVWPREDPSLVVPSPQLQVRRNTFLTVIPCANCRLQQLDEENGELRSCVPCLRANIERLEEVSHSRCVKSQMGALRLWQMQVPECSSDSAPFLSWSVLERSLCCICFC